MGARVLRPEEWDSICVRENPGVKAVVDAIAYALIAWRRAHESDDDYYRISAHEGLLRMLNQRHDLIAALRVAQNLPLDVEQNRVPVERPVFVHVAEFAVGFIPVVGTGVALYEAYSGRDLFGYALDPIERSILAASALLPLTGRFIKGGRALYTARRMAALYGRDAREWSLAVARGERISADAVALRRLRQAEETLRNRQQLTKEAAEELAAGFKRVGLDTEVAAVRAPVVPQAVEDVLTRLRRRYRVLVGLDELALQRVLGRGPNVDHLKGQLLEELIESRVTPWLRDPAGPTALGVEGAGGTLEFISGHLIRDAAGRQITDGIIGRRSGEVFEIMAIFEAKAGQNASRELRLASGTISSLTKEERTELRAYARDIYNELVEQARLQGTDVEKTIADIEREVALSERGGQVRRDIERLAQSEGGELTKVFVGGVETRVSISPTRTKVFGVLPRDVRPGRMERDLRDLGYNFEVLGIDVRQQELEDTAKELLPLVPAP